MMEIFKNVEGTVKLQKLDKIEKGCWVNLEAPTEAELSILEKQFNIIPNFLRDPLDEEERPRIDIEDNQILIIVDIPYSSNSENKNRLKFETIPMGIIITDECFITICLKNNHILDSFKYNKVKEFYTFKKTRFTFQILFSIAKDFLKDLRNIDKKSAETEKVLYKSMQNEELYVLLELQKGLVFFTTSLKSNEIVMEKLLRGKYIKMYEEDEELLEDVIIENKQAIEMANIYSTILSGTMDAFASIISNNLNVVMKVLTSVTIVMAIPTMVSSFFGMNVPIPFFADHSMGFLYILVFSIVVCAGTVYVMSKKKLF